MSTIDSTALTAAAPLRGRHAASRARGPLLRSLLGAVPVMLIGSLALTLGATPADAGLRKAEREPRPAPPEQPTGALDFATETGAAADTTLASGPATATALSSVAVATSAPAQALAPFAYTVVEGDTISDIAGRYGLSTASVLALNGLSWKSLIFPGQVLSLNASATPAMPIETPLSRYTIVDGDTIAGIAASHGIPTEAVLSANGLGATSIIFPGQSIVLPQLSPTAAAVVDDVLADDSPSLESIVAVEALEVDHVQLTDEMRGNAERIAAIGRELGVPDAGIVVALAAAMQESSLQNIGWGHLDSLGLFQQRPATGWGTPDEILDRDYAIRAFFGGSQGPDIETAGLLDVPGWQSMSVTEAAQAVQISAHPDAYAQWETAAWSWLPTL